MANDTILIPGGEHWEEPTTPTAEGPYLERDNYLGEYESEAERSLVRDNLNVYPRTLVYSKVETNTKVDEAIQAAFLKYLTEEDPHGILDLVKEMIADFVKVDGSTPFTNRLKGKDPIEDLDLVTKRFLDLLIADHLRKDDPHRIIPKIEDILEQYVKQSLVYAKSEIYTKNEVDLLAVQYIKKDGTTPFTKAQIGADPLIDSHLATKRYVDKVLYQHLVDIDPHGFLSILNQRLASYAKAASVYDKTQTYSRTLIDTIIRSLVTDAAADALQDHLRQFDPHKILDEVKKERYIKLDGSIPFRKPLIGVDAEAGNLLTTLQLVQELVKEVSEKVDKKETEWKTSGPVIGSAGLVEAGTEFAKTLTLQEIMDAIFYGKGINIIVDKFCQIGHTVDVTVCVQGSLAELIYTELYLNDKLIATFLKSDFEEESCITIESDPILEDTKFVFKAFYVNGSTHDVSAWTRVALPVFAGIVPKWKLGYVLTYQDLEDLNRLDEENNKFYSVGKKVKSIKHEYSFTDMTWKQFILAVPADYPELQLMCTPSQQFGPEAFEIIESIPFLLPNVSDDVIYRLYIYKEALIRANFPVTFNFVNNEQIL